MKGLIFLLMLLPFGLQAGLDEVVLSSDDKKCAIRYLNKKPMKGYQIKTNADCADGFVHGYHRVEVLSSHKEQSEILNGFFMDGYWLGLLPAKGHVLERTTPDENTQALTFILDEDKKQDITYVVQLRATQSENGFYSAFQGCPDFRLLVATAKKELFKNEAFQEQLAKNAQKYAQQLCAELDTIAVFGALYPDAQASDIVFQMQIDVKTKEKTLISAQTDFDDSAINQPIELRQENSQVLLSVLPKADDLTVQYGTSPISTIKSQNIAEKKLPITSLNHLDVQSRITQKPVLGRVIVHIDSVDLDGTAHVDLPQSVLLKYHPKLKIGWAVVQGMLFQNQIQVSDITICQKEWCSDVS